MRLIAIGDIHGEHMKLRSLLEQIDPQQEDQLVFLGDFVDRGSDSKGVIDCLIELHDTLPSTVFLRGNHDWLLLDSLTESGIATGVPKLMDISPVWRVLHGWQARSGFAATRLWFLNNAGSTLNSYETKCPERLEDLKRTLEYIPKEHLEFLAATKLWYVQGNFIFIHAPGAHPHEPLDEQDPYWFLWERECCSQTAPDSEKTVVHGHNRVQEVLFSKKQISLDTGAGYEGGKLSACNVLTGETWSAP